VLWSQGTEHYVFRAPGGPGRQGIPQGLEGGEVRDPAEVALGRVVSMMAGWLAASAHCAAGGQERQGRDGPGREMGGTGGQGSRIRPNPIGPVGPVTAAVSSPSSWTFTPHIPQATVHDDGFGPVGRVREGREEAVGLGGREVGRNGLRGGAG